MMEDKLSYEDVFLTRGGLELPEPLVPPGSGPQVAVNHPGKPWAPNHAAALASWKQTKTLHSPEDKFMIKQAIFSDILRASPGVSFVTLLDMTDMAYDRFAT